MFPQFHLFKWSRLEVEQSTLAAWVAMGQQVCSLWWGLGPARGWWYL